jgi:toxin YoeB
VGKSVARRIVFGPNGWADYLYWQTQDHKTLDRINALVRECQRDPFRGIGKPEPLKREYTGCWSRRIDDGNRFIYRVTAGDLEIIACRYHYGDR